MTTQQYEIDAWLGDALGGMTAGQIDAFEQAVHRIDRMYPDDQDERGRLLTSAHLAITSGLTLEQAAIGRAALRWLTVEAVHGGMSEVEAAQRADVDRGTVRRWLGK